VQDRRVLVERHDVAVRQLHRILSGGLAVGQMDAELGRAGAERALIEGVFTLDEAVRREVEEESGIRIEPTGLVGVYENVDLGVLVAVFRARPLDGTVRPQAGEILEAAFVAPDRLETLVTRPQARIRLADARRPDGPTGVHESYVPGGARARLGPARMHGL
jgi:8-oxo-dGTP diphosphatase